MLWGVKCLYTTALREGSLLQLKVLQGDQLHPTMRQSAPMGTVSLSVAVSLSTGRERSLDGLMREKMM